MDSDERFEFVGFSFPLGVERPDDRCGYLGMNLFQFPIRGRKLNGSSMNRQIFLVSVSH